MKMKKWFSLFTVLVLVLSLTACGGGASEEPEETGGEDDGQNPVMNFVGNYSCGRANIVLSAEGDEGASAVVTWGSSAAETSTWTMSGTFDAEKQVFEYSDGKRIDYVYNEDGDVDSEKTVYTNGKGSMTITAGDEGDELVWNDEEENVAADMVFKYTGTVPDGEQTGTDGVGNPWHDVDTAEEAAEGAGVDIFDVPDGDEISLGKLDVEQYRYMEGIAEARIPVAAVEMTIRKGLSSACVEPGDISGDYGDYEYYWTQNIKGLVVNCYGNREGEATKTLWTVDDYCYSVFAQGAGGDDDFGLNADDLSSIINSMQ